MTKELTITLDQEAYRRLCILLDSNDEETCIHYIEQWVKNACAHCYAPGELDAMFHAEGQAVAFEARMYARNEAVFADSTLENQFQNWLTEHFRAMEEERQLENKFIERLETDYKAVYEDPELEAEFKKWLLGGWLLTPDRELQEQAESWARSSVESGRAIVAGDTLSESR